MIISLQLSSKSTFKVLTILSTKNLHPSGFCNNNTFPAFFVNYNIQRTSTSTKSLCTNHRGLKRKHSKLTFFPFTPISFQGLGLSTKIFSPPHHHLSLSSTSYQKMADDASYTDFLNRANQDPKSGHSGEGDSTSQVRGRFDPSTESNEAIPAPLRNLQATYVSDTDSDFEPVFLSYSGHELPSVDDFKGALGVKGQNVGKIEELTVKEFDVRGEYKHVIDAVSGLGKGSAKGKVKIFRVEVDESGTRVEYYILTVGERKLLGVLAKAVES